ncbi:MAG: DUF5752 family protein [Thermodesulfobacteriota bacterium]
MEKIKTAFEFKLYTNLLRFTGRKAKGLRELREGISLVSEDSLFHHTGQYFLKGAVLEYTNDFAHWAGESLEERGLAEHLSNIDPYGFSSIQDLRQELLRVIDDYLAVFPEPRQSFPGDEFFFNETLILVVPLGIQARNLAEFLMAVKYVDPASIYYHFYEAKLRLGGGVNDFSSWMETALGKKDLAEKINSIDVFMHNLEEVRYLIADLVEKEAHRDMEVI